MTVSDLDVWRSANQIIAQYGAGAWIYAATMCKQIKAAGDEDGSRFWRRVADAIAEVEDVNLKNMPS